MNLSIFNKEDKSGIYRKGSFLIKNYFDEYSYIIDWCVKNKLEHLQFKLKVYHCINDLKSIPLCYCNNVLKFKNSAEGYNKYCSNKCQGNAQDIKDKKILTSLEKYGTEIPQRTNIVKQKTINTNQERYGTDYPLLNIEIKQKSINTLLINYGVDNPNKSKEILNKRVKSFKLNINQYKETYKKTSLDKYGVEHPWMVDTIHQKGIDKIKNIQHDAITNTIEEYNNIQNHKLVNIDWNIKEITCVCDKQHTYKITNYLYHKRRSSNINTCTICNKLNQYSGEELNLLQFIENNYTGIIIKRDRTILKGKELDIYLPELNIAFEFNGLYWHSEANKTSTYHLDKTNKCKELNIQLIHIWEDDWLFKQNIIKSIILNKLGKSTKIYARKCIIKLLTNKECKQFLNDNHLQGYIASTINIGLYYNDELVSLMTFGNLRKNVGSNQKENCYELYRMCNKLNTVIIGGSSKMFNYFKSNYIFNEIISYCNYSIYNGSSYTSLGFLFDKYTIPNYWWIINNRKSNRYNWRKDKLVKLGYDINKTEIQIMQELGSLRIYDCGSIKYIYKNL